MRSVGIVHFKLYERVPGEGYLLLGISSKLKECIDSVRLPLMQWGTRIKVEFIRIRGCEDVQEICVLYTVSRLGFCVYKFQMFNDGYFSN